MRKKRGFLLLISLSILFFLINGLSTSAEPGSHIQAKGEPTYYLYKTTSLGYYYYINITLYNSGDELSDVTKVQLYEDDNPTVLPNECPLGCEGVEFQPSEEKKFTFDWPTTQLVKTVEIRWEPASLDILNTEYNSGNYSLQIIHESVQNNQGTPGFEIPLILLTVCILIFLDRKKRLC